MSKKGVHRRNDAELRRGRLFRLKDPTASIPLDQRRNIVRQIGHEAQKKFDELEQNLDDALLQLEPIHALCLTAFSMVIGGSKPSATEQPLVMQHHVELLQALLLRHSMNAYKGFIGTPDHVQTAIDLVKSFFDARTKMPVAHFPDDDEALAREIILADIRLHTQFIRGDFYGEQLSRLFRPVLENVTSAFSSVHRAPPETFLDLLYALAKRIEVRLNAHIEQVASFWRESSLEKVCSAYTRAFPHVKGLNIEEMSSLMIERGIDLAQLKTMMISHSDLVVPNIFKVDKNDITTELASLHYDSDPESFFELFAKLSIMFGDLADVDVKRLPLDNPVWIRPFIQLEDGWLWPIPTGLIGFSPAFFQRITSDNLKLRARFERARASVLESKVKELFKEFLPLASIWSNVTWQDPASGKSYENDLLILIDRWLLIIEAKSGQVTDSARRGSFERIKREVKKLILDAAEQSKRVEDYIAKSSSVCRFHSKSDGDFELDGDQIEGTIRLTVTFENIGRLNARGPRMAETGLIPTGTEFVPTISLGSLDVVLRSLETPSAILHYLFRRREFEAAAAYEADELDLLTFYLETGFNIGDIESGENLLMIYGHSNDLDFKLTQSDRRPLGRQPTAITRYWGRLINELEKARPTGWIRLALRLRNVAWDDQVKIERMVRDATRKANRKGSKVVVGLYGPPMRREGIICLVHGVKVDTHQIEKMIMEALEELSRAEASDALFLKFIAPVSIRPCSIQIVETSRKTCFGTDSQD